MKQVIAFTCLILSSFLSLNAQMQENEVPLTFNEAIETALRQNYLIKQAEYHHAEKEAEKKAAIGLRMPSVTMSANYVLMSDKIHLDLTPVRDAITPLYETLSKYGEFSGIPGVPDNMANQIVRGQLSQGLEAVQSGHWDQTIQEKQFGVVMANAMWPIYTGGKINAANQAAKIELEESNNQHQQKIGALTSEVVERYFGLVMANQAEIIRHEVKEAMEKHYNNATELFNNGMLSKAELLHAQLQKSNAELEYKKADRKRTILNEALNSTLSNVQSQKIVPLTQLFYLNEIESVETFKQKAVLQNTMIKQVESKMELAHVGYKAERSEILPKIAAIGTYNLIDKDLSPYVPDYMAGVTLSWTIFHGGRNYEKIKAAKLLEKQVEAFKYHVEDKIETGIEKYYQELMMSLEEIRDLETSLNFAEEYARVREQAFSEGMATSTDVVDASLVLTKVRIDRLNAMYNYDVALSHLLELTGESEKFLLFMTQSAESNKTDNVQTIVAETR